MGIEFPMGVRDMGEMVNVMKRKKEEEMMRRC